MKLENYTEINLKPNYLINIPYKQLGILLLILILALFIVTGSTYLKLNYARAELQAAQQNINRLQQETDKQAHHANLGVLKPEQIEKLQGFAPYFTYLSQFKVDGLWLNRIHFSYNAKGFTVLLEGMSETPSALQLFLKRLTETGPFSALPLQIEKLSALKEETKHRRHWEKTDNTLQIQTVYQFTIISSKTNR